MTRASQKELPVVSPVDACASAEIPYLTITEGREHLSRLVREIETGRDVVAGIGRRGRPSAYLVSPRVFKNDHLTKITASDRYLAKWVVAKTVGDGPAPIVASAIDEVSELEKDDLSLLISICMGKAPSRNDVEKAAEKANNSRVFERLSKRMRIAENIREAEKEGLYDVAEHHMGFAV